MSDLDSIRAKSRVAVLDKEPVSSSITIDEKDYIELPMGARIDFEEHCTRRLVANIRAYILSETTEPTEIRVPRDWWQALKQRWFPKWALRRWPVVETVHEISFKVLYPYFKAKIPDEPYTRKVQVVVYDEEAL